MVQIRELLMEYREVTLELITAVESENYDDLEVLLDKRQQLINAMKELSYSTLDFKEICDEAGIIPLQKKLDGLMNKSLKAVGDEIKNLSAGKKLKNSYNKSYSVESIFFNKKI